jgi:anti-repressor protein
MNAAIVPMFVFEGREVRVVVAAGEPWFCAADVCAVLGHSNPSMAVAALEDDEKGLRDAETPGGRQAMQHISEPGLYKLVARSNKPEAKAFDRWVRHDVLPAIRKTGGYGAPEAALDVRTMAQLARSVLALTEQVVEQEQTIAVLAPRAQAWSDLADANGLVNLQTAGKALGLPPNLWIASLRQQGILFYRGRNLVARQDHIEAGRFTQRVRVKDGEEFIQTMVTPKGVEYFGARRPELRPVRRLPVHRPQCAPLLPLPGGQR